ncbi:MAG: hypothetical protein RIR97_293 [Pseudomonadota bacterium]
MIATGLKSAPTDVYLSFVGSLFGNRKTLFTGMFVHLFTYTVVYLNTQDQMFALLIFAYMMIAAFRTYWLAEFDQADLKVMGHADIARWENRYLQGAFATALLLGIASAYSVIFVKNNFAEIACITVTMGTMVSVVGRNFGSARVTNMLTLGACVPIMLGFLMSGSVHMALLAVLFIPFVLTTNMMAKGVREFLYQNVMAAREITVIADRFDIALNTMTHGLFMLNTENRILVANRKALDLFQLGTDDDVKERPLRDVLQSGLSQSAMSPERLSDVLGTLQTLIDGQVQRTQVDMSEDLCLEFTVSRRVEGDVVLIFEDVTGRVRAERRLTYIAHFDAMTGLPNRGHFADLVAEAAAQQAKGSFAGLMVMDIGEFKTVNDKKGHVFGDRLLCVVADAVQSRAGQDVICCRMMGDEFLLYFKAESSECDLKRKIQAFHAGMRGNYELENAVFDLKFSAGYVVADGSNGDIEDLQFRADLALAETKQKQRGGCTRFAEEMDDQYLERLSLKDDLRQAIDQNALTVQYQPMFRPDGLRIDCCEALCRWNHPVKGPVGPNIFIQLAEEMGIVSDITAVILRQAVQDCLTWPEHMHVSVNLSAQDLMDDTIIASVDHALRQSGLEPSRLHLEVTETSFVNEPVTAVRVLKHFRSQGITIAIDDFGTGYSSLSYLDGLPLDVVKIDRSFVLDICNNPRRFKLLRGAVNLSRDLGMKIVIEGVETAEQLALLSEHHCADLVQGYVFSRPVPNSAIITLAQALESPKDQATSKVA